MPEIETIKTLETMTLNLDISGKTPIHELTMILDEFCHRLEDKNNCVAIIKLDSTDTNSRQWPGEVDIQKINKWEKALYRMQKMPAVLICVMKNHCFGPALEILLTCDYRVAEEKSCLTINEECSYIWPSMGLYRMVQQIGLSSAKKIILSTNKLTAPELLSYGLIEDIFTNDSDCLSEILNNLNKKQNFNWPVIRQLLKEAHTTSIDVARGTYLAACDKELRDIGKNK